MAGRVGAVKKLHGSSILLQITTGLVRREPTPVQGRR